MMPPLFLRNLLEACQRRPLLTGLGFFLVHHGLMLGAYDFDRVFPSFAAWSAGGPSAVISDVYDPADASPWSVSFSEASVFAYSIKGTTTSLGDYTVRIGRGGQIFSIRANGQEWIPPQYRGGTTPDRAPWVDEVTQPVLVNSTLNTEETPYYIHGAGIYLDDPPHTTTPFFSPMLAATIDPGNRQLLTANWSQHAHVPTSFKSGAICFQRVTDRGEGILEIEYVLHNGGADVLNHFNLPWTGARQSSLPNHYLFSGGSRVLLGGLWADGNFVTIGGTDGYASFAASANANAPSLTVVFGKTDPGAANGQLSQTIWRYGTATNTTPPFPADETSWRNFYVATTRVRLTLNPGESLHCRYFLVIGRENRTTALIAEHGLVTKSGVTKLTYTAAGQGTGTPYYASLAGAPIMPMDTAGTAQGPWFRVSAAPLPGWRPLLVEQSVDTGSGPPVSIPYASAPPPNNIVASQTSGATVGLPIKWDTTSADTPQQSSGQTFILTEATTLDKLYLTYGSGTKSFGPGTHRLRLWIGEYAGSDPILPGTIHVFDVQNTTWTTGTTYAFDFPDLYLPAGSHAFQIAWSSDDPSHTSFSFIRANGEGGYPGGGRLYATASRLPFSFPPQDGNDAVFYLTETPTGFDSVLTDNFYQMAHPDGVPVGGIWRPYNGNTQRWKLLGFVSPTPSGIAGLGLQAAKVGDVLVPANTINGVFTRTLYAGTDGPAAVNNEIVRTPAGFALRHRVPVGWYFTLEQSSNLEGWLPFGLPGIGTNSTIEQTVPAPINPAEGVYYRMSYSPSGAP